MKPNKPDAPNPAIASQFHLGRHQRGVGDPERSPIHTMSNLTCIFGIAGGLLLSCWSIYAASTNAWLTLHIVSEQKIEGARFIDTPNLPKVGYIAALPDLTITNLQDVYPQKQANHAIMVDTNGNPRVVPSRPPPALALAVQLNAEDGKRFAALTQRALNKRLLVMLGSEPLTAPWVRAPIEVGSFTISFESEAALNRMELELKKLVR